MFDEDGKTPDGKGFIVHYYKESDKIIPYPTLYYTAAYASEWAPNGETEWNGYPIQQISQEELEALLAEARGEAALESVTRYVAAELGPKGISVHALSPGPLATRAASGIDHFDELLNEAAERAPTNQLATIEDVGAYAAFLASAEAANVTGGIHMIDGGYHIIG